MCHVYSLNKQDLHSKKSQKHILKLITAAS